MEGRKKEGREEKRKSKELPQTKIFGHVSSAITIDVASES